jgi:hypothetical protein
MGTLGQTVKMTDNRAQRRKSNRYRLEVPVIFSWKDAQANRQEQIGLTRDLSARGAFVMAATPPPLDAHIILNGFLTPGGQVLPSQMIGEGKVVRAEPATGNALAGFAVAGGRIVFRQWPED